MKNMKKKIILGSMAGVIAGGAFLISTPIFANGNSGTSKGTYNIVEQIDAYKNRLMNSLDHEEKDKESDLDMSKVKISMEQAEKTAMEQSKSGKIIEIKLDSEDGNTVYEIKIADKDQEKEYEIDANSGKVVKSEADDLERDEFELTKKDFKLSIDDIQKIIKDRYPEQKVKKIESDIKAGKPVYKVKLLNKGYENKLMISAQDGKTIK